MGAKCTAPSHLLAPPRPGPFWGGVSSHPPPCPQAKSPPCLKPTELPRTQQLAPGRVPKRTETSSRLFVTAEKWGPPQGVPTGE